jgi:hypothetical protein
LAPKSGRQLYYATLKNSMRIYALLLLLIIGIAILATAVCGMAIIDAVL